MIDSLKPYDDRKDSGLPWLGEIPTHWDVRRNGRLFAQRNQTGFPELPILEVSLKTGVRVRDFENSNRKQVMSDREKYKRARQGDIAYNMMRMWQGAVGTAPVDGLVSPAYVVAKPLPETESRYYQYLFRTGAYMDEVNKFSRGIVSDRNRLYWEDFKQMPSPCPPPEEQATIVRFLDHADRRIRRYIRAKLQLITLLNERKQAIIHRAVTRGLDPHVKLKPSGVEWLGDVPEHWDRLRLKNVARIQTGITLGKSYIGVELVDRPYLRVANVQAGHVNLSQIKTVSVPRNEIAGSELNAGDVLMTEGGDIDKLGRGCIWRGEIEGCLHQNHVFAVRPDQSRLIPEFLALVTESRHGRSYFEVTAKKTTNLAATNSTTVREFPLFLPSVREQSLILKDVEDKTNEIREALSQAEHEMDTLREYRTRLIADVVTGKLDVREAAAALPDELEAVEPDAEELLDEDEATDDVELDTEPEEVEA